jgi:hypothetical protein
MIGLFTRTVTMTKFWGEVTVINSKAEFDNSKGPFLIAAHALPWKSEHQQSRPQRSTNRRWSQVSGATISDLHCNSASTLWIQDYQDRMLKAMQSETDRGSSDNELQFWKISPSMLLQVVVMRFSHG